MGQSLLVELQPWMSIVARNSGDDFSLRREQWVDAAAFDAALFRVEIRDIYRMDFTIESAITDEESAFVALPSCSWDGNSTPPVNANIYVVPPATATTAEALYRWVRWHAVANDTDARLTSRIVALFKSST